MKELISIEAWKNMETNSNSGVKSGGMPYFMVMERDMK